MTEDIFAESRKNQVEFERVVAEMKPCETDYVLITGGKLVAIGSESDLEEIVCELSPGVYMFKRADSKIPIIRRNRLAVSLDD
uniref:Uncharacterized protein n=1 Tax=viral metagenome TaxID=1070528 RepID=A0A6C0JRT3_9ZZZZ